MAKKKMTEDEKRSWESLYYYVKDLLGYDENQALSSTMVLRLKGLSTNKFMENGNIASTANYSYDTILNTFKYCSVDIQRAFRTNTFKDEMHRFNFALKIVERNINTVYMKMKNLQRAKEEAKNTTVEAPIYTGANFKPREKKADKFTDLW